MMKKMRMIWAGLIAGVEELSAYCYGQKRWTEGMISKPWSSWKDKGKDFNL